MNKSAYFAVVIVLCAIVVAAYFIRRCITIRRNRFCPHCGHKMDVQKRSRDVDPQKEPVTVGGTYMVSGKAREYWSVLHCSACGHEIRL